MQSRPYAGGFFFGGDAMKRLLALVLCLLVCLTGASALAEEVTIVHVTDPHYLSPALTDYGPEFMALIEESDGKVTHYTPQIVQAFVAEMLAMQPDAVIISGDLTLNGARKSHEELVSLLTPLAEAGIRVLALPGNHDTNAMGYQFKGEEILYVDGLVDEDFDDLYARLGYEGALSCDPASMSYVAEVAPGLRVLLVDTNANGTLGTVNDRTLLWIEGQLSRAKREGAAVIAVSHQPAMIHNRLFTFGYVINNNTKLLALYEQYGVPLNLCGHLHMQHVVCGNGMTEVAASALAVAPNQYGVLKVQDGRLVSYAMQPLDVAAWAAQTGQTDPNLLDFAAYAADFFNQTTAGQTGAMVAQLPLNPEEKQQMIDFAVALNAEYFSGKRTLTADDPAWALWQQHAPGAFFNVYMGSILAETPQDMGVVTFPAK